MIHTLKLNPEVCERIWNKHPGPSWMIYKTPDYWGGWSFIVEHKHLTNPLSDKTENVILFLRK